MDSETRHIQLKKLALTLVVAAMKLRPYFQAHPIIVTLLSIKKILKKPEVSGHWPIGQQNCNTRIFQNTLNK